MRYLRLVGHGFLILGGVIAAPAVIARLLGFEALCSRDPHLFIAIGLGLILTSLPLVGYTL